MFFVSDTLAGRQNHIRAYSGNQAALGTLLAVIDFEWTVRRAIIALSSLPTKVVRADIEKSSGAQAYKEKWKNHVFPLRKKELESVVSDWPALKDGAFQMRHKIVHGAQVAIRESEAIEKRDIALKASMDVCNYSKDLGFDLYSRLPTRRKAVEARK